MSKQTKIVVGILVGLIVFLLVWIWTLDFRFQNLRSDYLDLQIKVGEAEMVERRLQFEQAKGQKETAATKPAPPTSRPSP